MVALMVCGLIYDLAGAAGANCDTAIEGKSEWCSIWGATEEPFSWNYKTQGVYVRSGLITTGLFVAAVVAPFFVPNAIVGVIVLLGLPYAGAWALTNIGLFGP